MQFSGKQRPGLARRRDACSVLMCRIRTSVRFNSLRFIGWLFIVASPLAAHGASNVQQEYGAVLQSKSDEVHGEQLFAKCAACHGTNGAGVQDGRVPAIAGQHFRVIAKELVDFRHDKRWDALMEHYRSEEHTSEP